MRLLHYWRAMMGIVGRELLRFLHQRERFISALVRPLVWLFVFAAGFRAALGIAISPPYETYILYEVYITPGLIGMIQLFNGMQSSLSMVYDREMGSMRMLMVCPLPRWFLLCSKLIAGTFVGVLQSYAFLGIAWLYDIQAPHAGLSIGRHDVGGIGFAVIVVNSTIGKFRRGNEFRHFPAVLHVNGIVSLMEN